MFSMFAREWRPLTALAVPLLLAMVGQMAITTTDMLMLGRLGPEAIAAAALGLSLFHPSLLLGIGIGLAVTPLVAQARSAHRSRRLRRVVRQGVWAAVPFSIVFLPVFFWPARLFGLIGQDEALSLEAQGYLRAMWPGLFFALLFNVLRSFLTAFELTRAILMITLVAIPLNAGANYILIFGGLGLPALGVFGAGLGSSLTNSFMGVALAVYCASASRLRRYALFNRFWRPDWSIFLEVHRMGVPIGLSIVLETSIFAGSAQIMGLIGTLELAAHQIAIQLASIAFMVPLGIGQAATARVGLAYGRHGMARARDAGWTSVMMGAIAMAVTAMLFWLAPELLIAPFLDESADALRVEAFAISFLAVAACFQLVDGVQVNVMHALRGLHDTLVPMWIAGFGYWGVALPLAIWLGLFTSLAGVGVWLGLAAGLTVTALTLSWRFQTITASAQKA